MDLLNTFVGGDGSGCLKEESVGEENIEAVELSLGLSMNGRFGVERKRFVPNINFGKTNTLIRASSVADFWTSEDPTPLTRTCSMPIDAGEEWKKRKELQSLRRSEAKRKRVEKLKNGKGLSTVEENCETKRRNLMNGKESSPPSMLPPLPRPSQMSIGSPASGGSSGISDLESQPFSGANKDVESKSTASQQSVSRQILTPATTSSVMNGNRSRDETLKMMLADMPCVSTKGDGVNGKKIEGFLYRYRKGEPVRIVCVCHGSFLTPAEFVKHGGGGDVEHPLRHIIINPPLL